MKYRTTNELGGFAFAEAYIADIQKINGDLQFTLDNVTILPENPCNRDVRQMRTNGLLLTIQDGVVEALVEEGYKIYDADGKLCGQYEDRKLEPEQYNDMLKALAGGESCIYSLEHDGNQYCFAIDASNDRTYILRITGLKDREEWDRFLNK